MKILRMILAQFLRRSQIKIEISGFDMDGFSAAMHRELSHALSDIAGCVYADGMTDKEKVEAIRVRLEEVI